MEFHPVADIFPMMSVEEFRALKADIAENGLREPIWTYEGKIIDGRNRYRACEAIGVKPRFREWDGIGSLVAFTVSLNIKRRHLTSSQLAVVALDIEKYLAEEARIRQVAAGSHGAKGGRGNKKLDTLDQIFDEGLPPRQPQAAEQAALIVGTNRQYVSDAKKIEKEAPDLIEKVRNGSASIPEAKREIKERERQERAKVFDWRGVREIAGRCTSEKVAGR